MATKTSKKTPATPPLYDRVRAILEAARANVARTVNTTQVVANWLIGCAIVEAEQQGKAKAGYGKKLLDELSALLTADFGKGYSATNLRWFRQFYLEYPKLVQMHHALSDESAPSTKSMPAATHHAVRDEFEIASRNNRLPELDANGQRAQRAEPWQPGILSADLSWTHYRLLLKLARPAERAFYEIEAIKNNWPAREMERQINSLLFDRLAKSKDKKGLMRLATRGGEIYPGRTAAAQHLRQPLSAISAHRGRIAA